MSATQDRPKIGHASGCVKINCAGCGTDFFSVDYSAVERGPWQRFPASREDFLTRLRHISAARVAAWANGEECDEMFHATELGGETGEILNVVKKLYRERRGWRGSRATVEELGEEIGDALICLDKLAAYYGIDLAAVTAKKFDATSEKVGLPHRLGEV